VLGGADRTDGERHGGGGLLGRGRVGHEATQARTGHPYADAPTANGGGRGVGSEWYGVD
jgi:hypothetical protein